MDVLTNSVSLNNLFVTSNSSSGTYDVLTSTVDSSSLFVTSDQSTLEQLGTNAIQNGINLYQAGDYKEAAESFARGINIAPQADYTADAAKYMASSYLKIDETENAIKAYKRGIELNAYNTDLRLDLANLYFSQDRYNEAETHYSDAVVIDPSAENIFSLGQLYLKQEDYSKSKEQFNKVISLAPESGAGYYGLGLVYSKMDDYEDAVEQFEKATDLDDEMAEAYAELGYTYADKGDMDKAQEIYEILEELDENYADTLNRYMYKVEKPKFEFVSSMSSTFNWNFSAKTNVATLDDYLINANVSKKFTMVVQFGKEMDTVSIQNRFNWDISRATSENRTEMYNFGLSIPDTEAEISAFPDRIIYDSSAMQATVTFTINQNSTADATIDPSHLVFKFAGKDVNGLAMDPEADEFSGYAGIA